MHYSSLSDHQLLAVVVGKRRATAIYRGRLSELFAPPEGEVGNRRLLAARELVRRSLAEELRQSSILNRPEEVKDYLRLSVGDYEHEVFVVLFLDAQNRLIVSEELFRGTISQTSVYPREVVKRSLQVNAAAVIFAHNHPSGLAEPSQADEALTRALQSALALVDVKVLDHIVVASHSAVSFAERGLV